MGLGTILRCKMAQSYSWKKTFYSLTWQQIKSVTTFAIKSLSVKLISAYSAIFKVMINGT